MKKAAEAAARASISAASPSSFPLPTSSDAGPSDSIHVSTHHSTDADMQDGEVEYVPTAEVANPLLEERMYSTALDDRAASRPVYVGGAACTAFVTRLRSHVTGGLMDSSPHIVQVYKHPSLARNAGASFHLPSRTYAHMLVQVVLRFVGHDYHLLQKRSFLRRVEQVYDSQTMPSPMFLCRMFVVLALGELYLKRSGVNDSGARSVPGTNFFQQAVSLFQDLYEEPDVDYIETLTLMVGLGTLALHFA